jgi:jumonji domain-containing protein 2
VYGADITGTLFDQGIPWNLNEIDSVLNYGLSEGINLAGVTTSYVYVGSWKSMFCWHKEDMDLYSVNYLHAGASKYWYSVDIDCN